MNRTIRTGRPRLRSRRGVASALIILLLVLLVFFGILSLVTTAADLRLSKKHADWNQQYYLADAKAAKVLSDLDQYCKSLDLASLSPEMLSKSLGQYLAELENIQDYQLKEQDKHVLLSVLVAKQPDQGQGIQITLEVETGKTDQGKNRLTVEGWTQWQPPFQYDGQENGIWKG